MRTLLLAALLLAAGPAPAAERTVGLSTFERLRVEGPFEVTVAPGSPSVRLTGDRAAIDAVAVSADGTTLVIRPASGGWGESPRRAAGEPVRIALASPALRTIVSQAGARVTATGLRAARIDLTVAGSGAIAATGVDADEVAAAVTGTGTLTLAGRAVRARLLASGPAAIDAAALDAGELVVIASGVGETRARARYTARIANTGLGRVTVAGTPKCDVRPATANVSCGPER